ncbi:MAG: AraC family transcriptional regulator [Deltaproteobacteria bacterium]|nr:AraC family transcriptional regulator [Deltaproteobacteria bacterium]
MADRPTALASLARYALAAAKDAGLSQDRLIAQAQLDPEAVADIDGRVPVPELLRLWEIAAEQSGDPFFGLHAAERTATPQSIHVVGFAARTAATLGEAVAVVGRFARVMNESTWFEVVRRGGEGVLKVGPGPGFPRWPRAYAEVVLCGYLVVGRSLAGAQLECTGASFQHAAPADVSEYRRIFGPRLTFDAPINSLSFRASALDLPLRFADPALSDYLHAQAAAMLERLPSAGAVHQRVRQALAGRLSEACEISAVARRLHLSTRSLQRALREEGTSFQKIRDEVRRSVALDLLHERSLSVTEISALVGYSDASAFRSAVQRWTGRSPRDARRAGK